MGGFDAWRDAGLPLLLDSALTFRVPGRATPVQLMGIQWGDLMKGSEIGHTGEEADRTYRVYSADATAASVRLRYSPSSARMATGSPEAHAKAKKSSRP